MTGSESRVDSALLVAADPQTVFEAFRNPSAVEQWLPPLGMTGRMLSYEFSEGGGYRFELRHRSPDAGTTPGIPT